MSRLLVMCSPWFWFYLFVGNTGWRNVWCRFRGHPGGPWFYSTNPEATEPDNRCKDCDEYIC